MKRILSIFSFVFLVGAAQAAPNSTATPQCSLHNLAACQSSNDLAWSRGDDLRRPKPHELYDAMDGFLRGAPRTYLGTRGFSAALDAETALGGPGDRHDHRPNGGWFFDGFTPHDATDRGAILLNADGTIRMVATLMIGPDSPESDDRSMMELQNYRLRLYCHGEPDAADISVFENWAKDSIRNENRTYPTEPKEIFAGTTLTVLGKARWTRRVLP